MNFTLYSDVILLCNLPEENVYAGDIGTVVEQHHVPGLETGYSVEFFDMLGNTVAIVTLPMSCFRLPTRADRPTVRLTAISNHIRYILAPSSLAGRGLGVGFLFQA